jgi:hypothetical protein
MTVIISSCSPQTWPSLSSSSRLVAVVAVIVIVIIVMSPRIGIIIFSMIIIIIVAWNNITIIVGSVAPFEFLLKRIVTPRIKRTTHMITIVRYHAATTFSPRSVFGTLRSTGCFRRRTIMTGSFGIASPRFLQRALSSPLLSLLVPVVATRRSSTFNSSNRRLFLNLLLPPRVLLG